MRIGFVCGFDVCVTHHAGKHLWSDTVSNCECCESMATVIRSHIAAADLFHELLEISFAEIDIIPVSLVAIDQTRATGLLSSQKQLSVCR